MSNQVHKIEVADEQSQEVDCDPLISVVQKILDDHAIAKSEISIAIVDDPAIRKLNKQYLNHDYETDVISFVLDVDESIGYLTGQLVVSTETAARMANEVGGTMQEELLLYVVHGTLHLVGFDDKDPLDAEEMRSAEKRYLHAMGIEHRWSTSSSNDSTTATPVDSLDSSEPKNDCGADSQ